MSPRRPDPTVRPRLVAAAARLMADEGLSALSARRLAGEVSASTMAVYTHFGSMDELVAEVRRAGFAHFAEALARPRSTEDAVADCMVLGFAYRRFALDEPHLYRAMFDRLGDAMVTRSPADGAAATATFGVLADAVKRCGEVGRWSVDDVTTAAETVWATVHGLVTIELGGYFAVAGRDAATTYADGLDLVARGHGDSPQAAAASLTAAHRRARRTRLL